MNSTKHVHSCERKLRAIRRDILGVASAGKCALADKTQRCFFKATLDLAITDWLEFNKIFHDLTIYCENEGQPDAFPNIYWSVVYRELQEEIDTAIRIQDQILMTNIDGAIPPKTSQGESTQVTWSLKEDAGSNEAHISHSEAANGHSCVNSRQISASLNIDDVNIGVNSPQEATAQQEPCRLHVTGSFTSRKWAFNSPKKPSAQDLTVTSSLHSIRGYHFLKCLGSDLNSCDGRFISTLHLSTFQAYRMLNLRSPISSDARFNHPVGLLEPTVIPSKIIRCPHRALETSPVQASRQEHQEVASYNYIGQRVLSPALVHSNITISKELRHLAPSPNNAILYGGNQDQLTSRIFALAKKMNRDARLAQTYKGLKPQYMHHVLPDAATFAKVGLPYWQQRLRRAKIKAALLASFLHQRRRQCSSTAYSFSICFPGFLMVGGISGNS